MNRWVSFHAMAEQELNDAASYYHASLQDLVKRFWTRSNAL
jgi:hypothetical protein